MNGIILFEEQIFKAFGLRMPMAKKSAALISLTLTIFVSSQLTPVYWVLTQVSSNTRGIWMIMRTTSISFIGSLSQEMIPRTILWFFG